MAQVLLNSHHTGIAFVFASTLNRQIKVRRNVTMAGFNPLTCQDFPSGNEKITEPRWLP
jgi:hypothetical protein